MSKTLRSCINTVRTTVKRIGTPLPLPEFFRYSLPVLDVLAFHRSWVKFSKTLPYIFVRNPKHGALMTPSAVRTSTSKRCKKTPGCVSTAKNYTHSEVSL